jgi:hypothetical protein
MRARGLVILAFLSVISSMAACAASPGSNSFSDDKSGDDSDSGSWHPTTGVDSGGGGGGTILADGGELLPDGAVVTPKGDGGFLGDGAAPISRLSCGSSYCRGDQTCNAGSCENACVGTNVPGDYATIQAALNAELNSGNDVTICLKAQTYNENVSISGTVTTPKAVHIIGVSAASTTVTELVAGGSGFSSLEVRGITFSTMIETSATTAPVQFIGDKIAASSYAFYDYGSTDVTLDGCDLSSTSNYAVYFTGNYSGPAQKLTVKNSYLHDSSYGAYLTVNSYYSGSTAATISLVNDTFDNDNVAIYTGGSSQPLNVTYANDLILNSKTTGIDQEATQETITTKDNALFGNVNNYAGTAVDGPGYVKADVKLDTSQTPPGLSSGSPARQAADSTMAPSNDYWDVARSSPPDIGAIQN